MLTNTRYEAKIELAINALWLLLGSSTARMPTTLSKEETIIKARVALFNFCSVGRVRAQICTASFCETSQEGGAMSAFGAFADQIVITWLMSCDEGRAVKGI